MFYLRRKWKLMESDNEERSSTNLDLKRKIKSIIVFCNTTVTDDSDQSNNNVQNFN
jgi:hypothetical protein